MNTVMDPHLTVTYQPDTDGTGKLTMQVAAGLYSGIGAAWFRERQLVEFACRLGEVYPLPPEGLPALRGGYSRSSEPPMSERTEVGLRFYPIGPLGAIGCRVELATSGDSMEQWGRDARVSVELVTSYEALRNFARALDATVRGQAGEAVLEAHET